MKKILILGMLAAIVAACEKPVFGEFGDEVEVSDLPTKKFTFTVKGDFGAATFTRGYLQADGKDMTDLWVFDYLDGECVQSVHQTGDDANWGKPQMALAYGSHHVYFVASRGAEPLLNADNHILTWDIVRDTFWKDYEVEVVSTSNGNRAVTLDRVVTKLRTAITDEVPSGCAKISVTPDKWYYGLDYHSGQAVSNQKKAISVTVPANIIGTTGELAVNIFGVSGSDEWTTNVGIVAEDADGNIIGQATIPGVPFKRNRSTEYSGSLFGSSGWLDVSINSEWDSPKTGTW